MKQCNDELTIKEGLVTEKLLYIFKNSERKALGSIYSKWNFLTRS